MSMLETDIAIIGGGLVGASLAALMPDGYQVMVLETFPLSATSSSVDYQPSYDARSTALSQSTYDIFRTAGVWQGLAPYAQPIAEVHVSDRHHWGSVLMRQREEGLAALGYVVDNARIGQALLQFLQGKASVDYCCPATVASVRPRSDGVELKITQAGQERLVHARLVVIADGARSQTCESLGIHTSTVDYGHTGIVANVTTAEPHRGVAYERFTDRGPLALLPLRDDGEKKNRSALVWTLPTDVAQQLLAASDAEFLQELQRCFGYRQGRFLKVGKRHAYPLLLSQASEQARRHMVVLGNAAHSLHPVAGQGLNLALRDVRALVESLKVALEEGIAPGELPVLLGYVQRQQFDQLSTTLFSDSLPAMFSSRNWLLMRARGAGLLGLELLPAVKSALVRFATGLPQV